MGRLEINDDQLHIPSGEKGWRESFYFNFVDLPNGISGFTTVGLMPSLQKREFVFALFHEGRQTLHFAEPSEPFGVPGTNPLSDGIVTYEQIESLKKWRLRLSNDGAEADLLWEGRFSPFQFGGCSGTSWSGHFEQSGIVTGTVKIGGARFQVKGLGHRDKSWGPRNWHIDSWFALHAQFSSFSIGLRRDFTGQSFALSGGISSAESHVPIASMELQTEYDETNIPKSARSRVVGADGHSYTLESAIISPTSYVRFTKQFPGGKTDLFEAMSTHRCVESGEEGTGLLEWLSTIRAP